MGGLASPKGAGRAAGRVFQQEPPGGAAAPSQEPGGTRVVPRPVGLPGVQLVKLKIPGLSRSEAADLGRGE